MSLYDWRQLWQASWAIVGVHDDVLCKWTGHWYVCTDRMLGIVVIKVTNQNWKRRRGKKTTKIHQAKRLTIQLQRAAVSRQLIDVSSIRRKRESMFVASTSDPVEQLSQLHTWRPRDGQLGRWAGISARHCCMPLNARYQSARLQPELITTADVHTWILNLSCLLASHDNYSITPATDDGWSLVIWKCTCLLDHPHGCVLRLGNPWFSRSIDK